MAAPIIPLIAASLSLPAGKLPKSLYSIPGGAIPFSAYSLALQPYLSVVQWVISTD